MSDKIEFTVSSGNLFTDLGRATPQEEQLKSPLARRISKAIRARGLTQQQAADVLGVDQSKVSALMRGRINGVSVERLLQHLTAFDNDVDIVVRPKASVHERGTVQVHDSIAARAALGRAELRLGSLRAGALTEARTDEAPHRRRWLRKGTARRLNIGPLLRHHTQHDWWYQGFDTKLDFGVRPLTV